MPVLQNRNAPSKSCSVSGCGGTMTFRSGQDLTGGPAAMDGSSGASWICNNNPSHVEVVSPGEEQSVSGG